MTDSVAPTILRTIDDSDPLLAGGYQPGKAWTELIGDSLEFNSTSHLTSTAGSSFIITFNGTLVTVFGTLDGSGGSSIYTLDNAAPITYVHPATPDHNVPFFVSGVVPFGQHTLNVTSAKAGGTLRLDYFQITTNSTDSFSTATSTASSGVTTKTVGSNFSSKATPHKVDGAIIAGIVAGCVAFLLLAVVVIALICRRMRAKRESPPTLAEKGFDILAGTTDPADGSSGKVLRVHGPAVSRSQATSSSQGAQSSTMFTSVVILSPIRSISEHEHDQWESASAQWRQDH